MGKNSGYMVHYEDVNGKKQKGVVTHSEQTQEIIRSKKCLIKLLDENFKPIMDESGRQKTTLKSLVMVNIIGYID